MSEPARPARPAPAVPVPVISEAEARLDRVRRTLGLFLGPALFGLLLAAPVPAPNPEAARLTAVLALVLVWWVTEAVPIPVTALLGPALAVVVGVAPAGEMFAPFGEPIIFLFVGSFVLAGALRASGLDLRLAARVLARRSAGAHPTRLLGAFVLVTPGLSGWLTNTATTAMLYPIALS